MKFSFKTFILASALFSFHGFSNASPVDNDSTVTTISILGDSYSTFEGYIQPDTNEMWYFQNGRKDNDVNDVQQTWWSRLIDSTGYQLCVNNSYSGSTISYRGYRGEDYTERSFITRCNNVGHPDILLIFGCTNDSWAGVPVGEYKYENITNADLYTFRPAMEVFLQQVTQYHGDSRIYFIINSELRPEIVESVNTLCERYNVPTIQLHDIDKQAGHPSQLGMQQISEQVKSAIAN